MISEKVASQILQIATDRGFIGVRNKKIMFESGSVADRLILSTLNFPESLRAVDELEYYKIKDIKSLALRAEVISILSKQVLTHDIKKSGVVEVNNLQEVYDSLELFKVSGDHVKDKGHRMSSGFSLVALNGESRHIIDWNKLSPDVVLARRSITRPELPYIEEIPEVVLDFNPLIPDLTFSGKDTFFGTGKDILYLNTAVPPYWMRDESFQTLTPKIGPFISRLISHLFPIAEEREFVLDWCHHLLFNKNGTVLCMAGDRGTGKTTFVEILEILIGKHYAETVNDAVLKDKFNSQFHNKRLIVFEEVSLEDKASVAKIKAWCNNKISIEKKGQDAFTADNWSSMVFLMNDISNLGINAQERRFSIPEVATRGLLTAIPEKEVGKFKEGMLAESEEVLKEIAEFGLFLRQRKPKVSEYQPLKGEYFYKVADAAMATWHYTLREYVLENGIIGKLIPIEKIFPNVGKDSGNPHKPGSISAWLSDYRYKGVHKIGTIQDIVKKKTLDEDDFGNVEMGSSRTRRNYGVMPNEELLKQYGKKYQQRVEDLL